MSDSGKQVVLVMAEFFVLVCILFVVLFGWDFKITVPPPVNCQL